MLTDVFYKLSCDAELPDVFPSPFDVRPHAVAAIAAQSLMDRLPEMYSNDHPFNTIDGGKMLGVLVVRNGEAELGYLSGFSGMLGKQWECAGFVPPVFDQSVRETLQQQGEISIEELSRNIEQCELHAGYRQSLSDHSEYRAMAEKQLEQMKAVLARKKLQRDVIRKNISGNELNRNSKLAELANQSRCDKLDLKSLKHRLQERGSELETELAKFQSEIDALKKQRKALSAKLQADLFDGYELRSNDGQSHRLSNFFANGLPPSGAGDCAATKLLQFANVAGLEPVALAEFWWGAAPVGGLREHGRFYPSCRSRCRVVLPFMLQGLKVSVPLHEQSVVFGDEFPHTLYVDDDIVVVEKPAGLLSVPGKVITDSVELRLKARFPEVAGVMLLHRLDQATSGVMIAARNPRAYKLLQHQFQNRTIKKCYVAVLDGVIEPDEGSIELPLRIDFYDRPRQIVCHERGKTALTRYRVISRENKTTRIAFYPHTGRTHQLRVHAAHPKGLNCAILGDELYGRPLNRLHLHAAELTFNHPVTDHTMSFSSDVEF